MKLLYKAMYVRWEMGKGLFASGRKKLGEKTQMLCMRRFAPQHRGRRTIYKRRYESFYSTIP